MAVTPVEVKKTPAPRAVGCPWQNFYSEFVGVASKGAFRGVEQGRHDEETGIYEWI